MVPVTKDFIDGAKVAKRDAKVAISAQKSQSPRNQDLNDLANLKSGQAGVDGKRRGRSARSVGVTHPFFAAWRAESKQGAAILKPLVDAR